MKIRDPRVLQTSSYEPPTQPASNKKPGPMGVYIIIWSELITPQYPSNLTELGFLKNLSDFPFVSSAFK